MNSAVLSMTIADVDADEPVKQSNINMEVTFQHASRSHNPPVPIIRRRLHEDEEPSSVIGNSTCFYYDFSASPAQWVHTGCFVVESKADVTVCRCSHLSSFAVLVGVHDYVPDVYLEILTMVCSGLTITALIATLLILIWCRNTNDGRSRMGKDLCCCLLLAHIIFISVVDRKFFNVSEGICVLIAMFLHYILLAAFFWMMLEAYHLYMLVVVVFTKKQVLRFSISIAVGYGLPAVIVSITYGLGAFYDNQAYGRDELCWLKPEYIWGFDGPMFLITAVNLIVIIISMKAAVLAKLREDAMSMNSLRIWVKGLSSLSALLGVTWATGLAYMDGNIISAYLFVILNGLQGVFIFIFRCVLNEHVRLTLKTNLMRFLIRRNISQMRTVNSGSLGKTGSASVSNSSEVKVIIQPATSSGPWFFKAGSRKRQPHMLPCDQMMRQMMQKRLQTKISSHSLKHGKNDKLTNPDEGFPSAVSDSKPLTQRVIPKDFLPGRGDDRFALESSAKDAESATSSTSATTSSSFAYHSFTILEDSESSSRSELQTASL